MLTIALFGLTIVLGVAALGATAARPILPSVIYLRAEAPVDAGSGDLGFAIIIFAILALMVVLAVG